MMKRLIPILATGALGLTAVAAMAAQSIRPLEPATELAPWAFAAALLLVLTSIIHRQAFPAWLAMANVLIAVTLGVAFGPAVWRLAGNPHAPSAEPDLRVMSLNLWFDNRDIGPTIELVHSFDPQILLLTEAGESALEEISRALPNYTSRYTCETIPYCGVAIFSRLPGRALPGGADLSEGLSRPLGDWSGVPLVAAEFRLSDGEWFPVLAVHLLRRNGVSADRADVEALIGSVAGLEHPERAILAGDLNSGDWSWSLRRIDEAVAPRRRTLGLRTWPAPSSPIRRLAPTALVGIDHVFAGDAWETVAVRRGPDVGSDHYPVLSAFRKAGERRPSAGE